MSDLNRKDFTRKQWEAEYCKRYRKTGNRKVSSERYKKSSGGKAKRKAYEQSARHKDLCKIRKRRYRATEKYRLTTLKRYIRTRDTEKYRAYNCQRAKKRQCQKLKATVAWSNEQKIASIYLQSQRKTLETGLQHSVDHIVPLQGTNVCGLHVEGNLRVILSKTNKRKANAFTPTTEQLVIRLMTREKAA